MNKTLVRVGLDDVAEGTGSVRGWGYLALDEVAATDLITRHAALLVKHGVAEFHGKEYRQGKDRVAYEDLADELANVFQKASVLHYGFTAWPDAFSANFAAFGARVSGAALTAAVPAAPSALQDLIESQMPALMWLVGEMASAGLTSDHSLVAEVDASQETKEARTTFQINGKPMLGEHLVSLVSRSHARVQFAKGPVVESITFVDSKSSAMVQAVDVLTNFALNLVREVGGHTTARAAEKTAILARAIGSVDGNPDLAKIVSVTKGEITITDPSQLPTLRVKHE